MTIATFDEDGRELSEYERKRLERIKKNEEHLKRLGLDRYQNFMRKKSPPKRKTSSPRPHRVKPWEERRSGRLSSTSGTAKMLMLDYSAEEGVDKVVGQDEDEDFEVISYRKPRSTRLTVNRDEWELSKEELRLKDYYGTEEKDQTAPLSKGQASPPSTVKGQFPRVITPTNTSTTQSTKKYSRKMPTPGKTPLEESKEPKDFIGSRIAKDFNAVTYFGTIDKYLSNLKCWHVAYDDGDDEDYDTQELRVALDHYEMNKSADEATPTKSRGKRRYAAVSKKAKVEAAGSRSKRRSTRR